MRSGSAANDYNGDGLSDILWRDNTTGDIGYYDVSGGSVT